MVTLARPTASPGRRARRSRVWLLAGLFAGSAVALVDGVRHHEVLLTGVLIAPLIAAIGASTLEVGLVGLYAVALAVLLGEVNDIFFTSDHLVRIGVVAATGLAAMGLTRVRERREQERSGARAP